MIRFAASAILVAVATGTAAAGDFADRAILGFSPDGAFFAFEEYGVQDGSGFAYSNIFVIDTTRDAWVPGTPVRVVVEDETGVLHEARAQALAKAEPVLAARGIAAVDYRIVASNPPTELSADPHAVRFLMDNYANQLYAAWDLKLTPLPMPASGACADFGPVHGFRLDLTDPYGDRHTLHEDRTIPASRYCPQDYAVTDIVVFRPVPPHPPVVAILLTLSRQGFEGPDRRYLAVTTRSLNF